MIDIQRARKYYYERETQRRMQRETERQQWLQRIRTAIIACAPRYPDIRRVFLFGSLLQQGRFRSDSDIDVAIECETPVTESAFWRTLEDELGRDVDVRPFIGVIAEVAISRGEQIYERQNLDSHQ
jgi:predicted nucleotidyltransferase